MDWGLIGIVLAAIFFITTLVLMLKYRRVKKLVWSYNTNKVIGLGSNAPPELQLLFGEKHVDDVYRTNIIVYNAGNESLRKTDVTEDVKVRFSDVEILRPPTIKARSKKAIQFSTRAVKKRGYLDIMLEFLYLDHNDGAVVEILHTKSEDLSCSGNIIGVKKLKYRGDFQPRRPSLRKSFKWHSISPPLMTLTLFGLIILIASLSADKPIGSLWEDYSMVFSVLGGMILGSLLGWFFTSFSLLSSFPKWSVIKG